MSAPTRLPIGRCGSCFKTWRGEDAAHCASCHVTFASVALFETHRRPTRTRGLCQRPDELGMVTRHGLWHLAPMPVADRRALWAARQAQTPDPS